MIPPAGALEKLKEDDSQLKSRERSEKVAMALLEESKYSVEGNFLATSTSKSPQDQPVKKRTLDQNIQAPLLSVKSLSLDKGISCSMAAKVRENETSNSGLSKELHQTVLNDPVSQEQIEACEVAAAPSQPSTRTPESGADEEMAKTSADNDKTFLEKNSQAQFVSVKSRGLDKDGTCSVPSKVKNEIHNSESITDAHQPINSKPVEAAKSAVASSRSTKTADEMAKMGQSNVRDSEQLDKPQKSSVSSAKKPNQVVEVKSLAPSIRKSLQVDQQLSPVDAMALEEKPNVTLVGVKSPDLGTEVPAEVKKNVTNSTGSNEEPDQAVAKGQTSRKQVEVTSIGKVEKMSCDNHVTTISNRPKKQSIAADFQQLQEISITIAKQPKLAVEVKSLTSIIKRVSQEDEQASVETTLDEKTEVLLASGLDTEPSCSENKPVSSKSLEASKVAEVPSQLINKLPKDVAMFSGSTAPQPSSRSKVPKLAVEVPSLASDSIKSPKVDQKSAGSKPVNAAEVSIRPSQPKTAASLVAPETQAAVSAGGLTGKSVTNSSPVPSNAEESQTLAPPGTPLLKALYCHKCGLLFDDFDSLHQHIFQSSDSNHSFRCAHCNFIVGKSLVNLLDHMKKYCSIGQITKVEREQVSEPSSGNNYFCELCGKGVKVLLDLLGHYAQHKASWLCCSSCEENCSNFRDLVFHYRQHVVFGNIMLRCHICTVKFFSAVTYKRHYSVVHRKHEYVPFECEWCDDVIVDDECKFLFHVQSHCIKGPQIGRRNVDVTELTCEECAQMFPDPNKCRVHKEVFHRLTPAKIVKCSSCRKRKMYGEMEDHMDAHQKVKAAKLNALAESTVVPKIRRKRNRSKKAAKNLKIRREARERVAIQRQKRQQARQQQQQVNKSLWNMNTWNNQRQAQYGWQPPYQYPTQMPNMVPQPYPPAFSAQPFYPPPLVPPFTPNMPHMNLVPNSQPPFTNQPPPNLIQVPVVTEVVREAAPVAYLKASSNPVSSLTTRSTSTSESGSFVAQRPKPPKIETPILTDVQESSTPVVYLGDSPKSVATPTSKSMPLSISSPKNIGRTPKAPKPPKITFNLLPPTKTETKNVTKYNVQSSKLFLEWCSKDDEGTSVTVKTSQWNADRAKDIASASRTGDQVHTSSNPEGGTGYEKLTSTSNSRIEWEVKRITESSNPYNPFEGGSSDSCSEREESFLDNLPIESYTDPSELPSIFPTSLSKSKGTREDYSSRDKQTVGRLSWTSSQASSIDRKEKDPFLLKRERYRNRSRSPHTNDDRGRFNRR